MAQRQEQENALCKTFTFIDFSEAFAFMTRVALLAEQQQHHPDWSNGYNKVIIKLTTHDQGSHISDKDRALAKAIDTLVSPLHS